VNFYGCIAASKLGETLQHSFLNGEANRVQLMTTNHRPTLFVLRATADVYIKQGNASVTASTADILLRSGNYFMVVVESVYDSYLSCYGSGGVGVLHYTNASRVTG
jgi:hypothetical protein